MTLSPAPTASEETRLTRRGFLLGLAALPFLPLVLKPQALPASSLNPFANTKAYVWKTTDPAPYSQARITENAFRSAGNTVNADLIKLIADQPTFFWLTGSNGPDRARDHCDKTEADGSLARLVLYYIPNRDPGAQNPGGASNLTDYQKWVDGVATGIGARRCVVVIEPDAIGNNGAEYGLSNAQQTERIKCISYAVTQLSSLANTEVYIAAPGPRWHPPDTVASRLTSANVAAARGFAINWTGFVTTGETQTYAREVRGRLSGDKRYIIDTARNGLGPTSPYQWCNPPGRALGTRPTADIPDAYCDAYVWSKMPGVSDGLCGEGATYNVSSGTWSTGIALGLASRAAYSDFDRPVNSAPQAKRNRYKSPEDKTLIIRDTERPDVLRNDIDPDRDRLMAKIVQRTRHGNIKLNANGSLIYKPKPNFSGQDRFKYKAFDGKLHSNTAEVVINVRPRKN